MFDEKKAVSALLYLAGKKGAIDLYALVKIIYFADKAHLKKWGRTITGDQYVRMDHGPVPNAIYDIIKSARGDNDWRSDLKSILQVENNMVAPLVEPDLDEFSESDIEELDRAFESYAHKSFSQLKHDSHDSVYNKSSNFYIKTEDLAEDDLELIAHIRKQESDQAFFEKW
jgi:uncharacterized phage-associated protein